MEINDIRLKELVNPVCEIAKQAGAKIMKIYAEGFEIEKKKDHSPLTTADLASNTLIIVTIITAIIIINVSCLEKENKLEPLYNKVALE